MKNSRAMRTVTLLPPTYGLIMAAILSRQARNLYCSPSGMTRSLASPILMSVARKEIYVDGAEVLRPNTATIPIFLSLSSATRHSQNRAKLANRQVSLSNRLFCKYLKSLQSRYAFHAQQAMRSGGYYVFTTSVSMPRAFGSTIGGAVVYTVLQYTCCGGGIV